ncbi:helix-turn-helix domain-containing protein [Paenibacillus sp. LMG 31459]|uniref:Helix-turn-helix domain-containing protein n=2 Tax=Paenibacillus phytohabitans TaxID=2654978 RepID=A0ABX1YS31_9BACL|nr:helix-turn-helix transcriptional regulator [Paenibacillus phytohabitans]NOU83890.1 helix-turn-helix domain-containing protein [Paenibacillus phytohabitans]
MRLVEKLGNRIRLIRKEKGLSQEQLAEVSGLHTNYIGAIERGEKNVTVESLEKVSLGLGITMDELFRYIDPMLQKDELTTLVELLNERSESDRKMALSLLSQVFQWEAEKHKMP